jgi:predicted nucleotidyltransferase
MNLEKDFEDFVGLLNLHDVEYMVVGGYALAFHGEPRTTGDMDIWIECTEENAKKMVRVMIAFGMGSLGFKAEDFIEPGIINQIGQPPLRIDILNEIDGVHFADAVKSIQYFKSGKIKIPFIGRDDFIKNKNAVGRKKDIEDLKIISPRISKKNRPASPKRKNKKR